MMQLSMAHGMTGNVGYLKAKVGDKIPQFQPSVFEFRCQSNHALFMSCKLKIADKSLYSAN